MKILLINPPKVRLTTKYRHKELTDINLGVLPSLGLGYLTATLKRVGHEAKLINMQNYSWESAKETLLKERPEVVGITCLTEQRHSTLKVVQICKEINAQMRVVLGGPHAYSLYEQILLNYPIDAIVIGEGELTLVELINAWERGTDIIDIPGLAFRHNGKVIKTQNRALIKDLDWLPMPYSFYNLDSYRIPPGGIWGSHRSPRADKLIGSRYLSMTTTRGCPDRCEFCSTPVIWGYKYRYFSINRVLDELEFLQKDLGVKLVFFADDIFTANPRRTIAICQGIVERKLDLEWWCQTRVDAVSRELFHWMKKAGCFMVCFGVESGSPKILKNMNKRISPKQTIEAFRLASESGISTSLSLMIGSPGETQETIKETAILVRGANPVELSINFTEIYPNNPLYDLAKAKNFITDDYWLTDSPAPFYTVEFNLNEMERAQKKIWKYYYLGKKMYLRYLFSAFLHKLYSSYTTIKIRDSFYNLTGIFISRKGIRIRKEKDPNRTGP